MADIKRKASSAATLTSRPPRFRTPLLGEPGGQFCRSCVVRVATVQDRDDAAGRRPDLASWLAKPIFAAFTQLMGLF